jgi:hypothetical protein
MTAFHCGSDIAAVRLHGSSEIVEFPYQNVPSEYIFGFLILAWRCVHGAIWPTSEEHTRTEDDAPRAIAAESDPEGAAVCGTTTVVVAGSDAGTDGPEVVEGCVRLEGRLPI